MADLRPTTRQLRRLFLRYRRLIAATLAGAAVWVVVSVLAPAPPPTTPVVVAATDLAGGTAIRFSDLALVQMPSKLVAGGVTATPALLVGQTLAAPVRAGEAITDRRVVGDALVAGYADGLVATPVRIEDADVTSLLRVGDHLDVYASVGDGLTPARRVVTDAPVVTLPRADAQSQSGALIVLAVTQNDAAELAQASSAAQLSVSLR